MLVVDNAAKVKDLSENPRAFMWGALLHDLGKAPTTKIRKGKITSYDHDTVGAELCRKFLETFTEDEAFIKQVTALVRWHMQTLFVLKDLPFGDVKSMSLEISIKEIALLSQCDRLGRGEISQGKIKEEKENIKSFIRKCEEILVYHVLKISLVLIIKVYIVTNAFTSPSNSTIYFVIAAKNRKLADAQTCDFLYAAITK